MSKIEALNNPAVPLVLKRIGRAFLITFDRPQMRNALSLAIVREITHQLEVISTDVSIDKVIFTGRDGIFASGANLQEVLATDVGTAREFAEAGQGMMSAIENCGKLTIAAVNGLCYGGALDLAMSCNKRIAAPNATFCHPGANIGIMTGWGGTQKLPRLIGEAAALEMLFTAVPVTAPKALSIGLIDSIDTHPLDWSLAVPATDYQNS